MSLPMPFFRESGSTGKGAGVVCLHSNASSSSQWRGLMDRLAPRRHVLALDSYGAGKTDAWSAPRGPRLADEAALAEPVFQRAGEPTGAPFVLVGHSYGAAVALIAALQRPERVLALALYEPTLFSLIEAESPAPNEADGIRDAVSAAAAALDAGDAHGAARCFIDYWMAPGTFDRMPEARQQPIAAAIVHVRRWAEALMSEPTPIEAYARLGMPVLLMTGGLSPASSRGVARRLSAVLPRVQVLEFAELGHMGPVTHPDAVNAAIERYLDTLD